VSTAAPVIEDTRLSSSGSIVNIVMLHFQNIITCHFIDVWPVSDLEPSLSLVLTDKTMSYVKFPVLW